MYDMMKKQNFGVEIELTGITREQAANVIATYFGTQARYLGTYYKTYGATDRKGRTWKAMSDGSILTERKSAQPRSGFRWYPHFPCEVVTPSFSTRIWMTCRTSFALSARPGLSPTVPAASTSMWTARTIPPPA